MASLLEIPNDTTPFPALRVPPPHTEFTIGWICVLKDEFRAAVSILDEKYDTAGLVRAQGDRNHYVLGRVGMHNLMINLPPADTYGTGHAQTISINMRSAAPSDKHDIRLGDVVLGTKVVPYAHGRETDHGFEQTGITRTTPRELLELITFMDERLWWQKVSLSESIEQIRERTDRGQTAFLRPTRDRFYKASYIHQGSVCDCLQPESQQRVNLYPRKDREVHPVQVHRGTIGSDNHVMKNALRRDYIAQKNNILCFEMEATGVMDVTPCLPIRGISDYSDGHKNDDWHPYAALAAAVCARELLLSVSPQIIAQFPVTIAGNTLDRYILGAVSNPSAFAGSEVERLRHNRDSLMERHALLEELMVAKLRKMHNIHPDDMEDARKELQDLKDLQNTLKIHLQDLDRIMRQHDDLLLSQDPAVREEYRNLKSQVQKDAEAMENLSEVAQKSLQTTCRLLIQLGTDTGNLH
ncbi:unnamed protein product [Penicillium pancosmium]